MKIVVFCAWGDGPDVGINITRTEEEAKGWKDPHLNFFLDFTADEADALADELRMKAATARKLNQDCDEYFRKQGVEE